MTMCILFFFRELKNKKQKKRLKYEAMEKEGMKMGLTKILEAEIWRT